MVAACMSGGVFAAWKARGGAQRLAGGWRVRVLDDSHARGLFLWGGGDKSVAPSREAALVNGGMSRFFSSEGLAYID